MEDPEIAASAWNKMVSDGIGSYRRPKRFCGDICSFDASDVVACMRHEKPIRSIVYVKSEEARVFFEVVLPSVTRLANERRIVLSSLQIEQTELSEHDFPLFMINAAETKFDLLKRFMRLEGAGGAYLKNPENPAFIYIYNTGATVEKLSPLMTGLVDGVFYECYRSESTHVVISGVIGQSGITNCLDLAVSSRCAVSGVEWESEQKPE